MPMSDQQRTWLQGLLKRGGGDIAAPSPEIDAGGRMTRPLGNVSAHSQQGPAIRAGGDTGQRLSESEHVWAKSLIQDQTRNPATGVSPYDDAAYERSPTLKTNYDTARVKTNGDMEALRGIRKGTPGPAELEEAGFQSGIDRELAAGQATGDASVTMEGVNTAAHGQLGELSAVGTADASEAMAGLTDAEMTGLMQGLDNPTLTPGMKPLWNGRSDGAPMRGGAEYSTPDTAAGLNRSANMMPPGEQPGISPMAYEPVQATPPGQVGMANPYAKTMLPGEQPGISPMAYEPVQATPPGQVGMANPYAKTMLPGEQPGISPMAYEPVQVTPPGQAGMANPYAQTMLPGEQPAIPQPRSPFNIGGNEPLLDTNVHQMPRYPGLQGTTAAADEAGEVVGRAATNVEAAALGDGAAGIEGAAARGGMQAVGKAAAGAEGAVGAEAGAAGGLGGLAGAGAIGGLVTGGIAAYDDYGKYQSGEMTGGHAVADVGAKAAVGVAAGMAGAALGAEIGAAAGTVVPGLGNVIGFVGGAVVGGVVGYVGSELMDTETGKAVMDAAGKGLDEVYDAGSHLVDAVERKGEALEKDVEAGAAKVENAVETIADGAVQGITQSIGRTADMVSAGLDGLAKLVDDAGPGAALAAVAAAPAAIAMAPVAVAAAAGAAALDAGASAVTGAIGAVGDALGSLFGGDKPAPETPEE